VHARMMLARIGRQENPRVPAGQGPACLDNIEVRSFRYLLPYACKGKRTQTKFLRPVLPPKIQGCSLPPKSLALSVASLVLRGFVGVFSLSKGK